MFLCVWGAVCVCVAGAKYRAYVWILFSCRHRKRGLAILPTKFGISFTFKPMNQAGALVSIFLDGSISVAHGGVEMGQGLLHSSNCARCKTCLVCCRLDDRLPFLVYYDISPT